jgi:hypothetical protein
MMKNTISTTLVAMTCVATTMLAGAASVHAAQVKGDVKTKVAVGVVLQKNTGIANTNSADLGSVTGKSSRIGGNFNASVKTAAIIQNNKGIANKNSLAMGSVRD